MAQPVRQCRVALAAIRFRSVAGSCMTPPYTLGGILAGTLRRTSLGVEARRTRERGTPCACSSPRRSASGTTCRWSRWPRPFRDGGHDVRWATSADGVWPGRERRVRGVAGRAGRRGPPGPDRAVARGRPRRTAPGTGGVHVPPGCSEARSPDPWPPTCCRSPEPGARTCSSTSTASWRRRWSERCCGVPSVTHSFGGAIPTAILDSAVPERRAALGRAGARGAAVRRLLLLALPRHLPGLGPGGAVDHVPAASRSGRWGTSAARAPLAVDDGRPLVYVTLGTVQNHPTVLRAVVTALAAAAGTSAGHGRPGRRPGELGDQPPHVTVERWVEQAVVLRHCAVVVSHAGSGTFLGTLAEGRPAVPPPGGRPVPQRRRRRPSGRRAGAGSRRDHGGGRVRRGHQAARRGRLRSRCPAVATEIAAMPAPAQVVAVLRDLVG